MGVFASAKDGGRSSILGKVMRLGLPHRKLKKTPEELAQAKADRIAAKRQHELVRQQALAAEREQKRISDSFAKLLKVERSTRSASSRRPCSITFACSASAHQTSVGSC
jgi:hypothetical protein